MTNSKKNSNQNQNGNLAMNSGLCLISNFFATWFLELKIFYRKPETTDASVSNFYFLDFFGTWFLELGSLTCNLQPEPCIRNQPVLSPSLNMPL